MTSKNDSKPNIKRFCFWKHIQNLFTFQIFNNHFMQWFNLDELGTYNGLLNQARGNSAPAYKGIHSSIDSSNEWNVQLINTTATRISVNSQMTFATSTWYHAAFTYDGSTNASGVKQYVNGVALTLDTVHDDLGSNTIAGSDVPLLIGERIPGGGTPLDGKITLGMIYNRELSATEILQNYNATKNRFQ